MEKAHLKTGMITDELVIDKETSEVLEQSINRTTYLANTKEEFYLMYSSMVLILKGSSDVRMKLFASLLERYSTGQEFSMNKALKERIAIECHCSARSLDLAFTKLVKDHVIVLVGYRLYQVNPRHVFQGSSSNRNKALQAILELGCKDC